MFALRTRLLTSAVAFRGLVVPQNFARINTSSTTSFARFQSASTLTFNERLFSTATPAQPESEKDQQQTSASTVDETPKAQDKVAVPKDLVKFIIGPKGAILKHLCERSGGASLTFTKEFNEQNEEIAAITGDEKQVASLKQLVAEEIERAKAKAAAAATQGTEGAPKKPRRENNSREGGASSYAEEVIVDSFYVGSLIGKQGIVLKEMERVSGARISYSDREAESKERTARISGSPQQVQSAKDLISQKVNEIAQQYRDKRNAEDGSGESRQRGERRPRGPRQPQANDVKQVVEVPTECVGYLIGRGGRGLFNIQDQTQTKIDFARHDHREGAREVTIYGSEDSVQKACDLIQQRVKESLEKAKERPN